MSETLHYLRFKNLSKNWEKYVLNWENGTLNKLGIGNFVHTAEFLALGKPLNIYIDHLMFQN